MLLILMLLFSNVAMAGDSVGVDVGFGLGSKPSYGADYQFNFDSVFNKGNPYVDVMVMANSEYVQPYLSTGLTFDHINVGFGITTFIWPDSSSFAMGPECGYTQNLNKDLYVKESNYLLGFDGKYNFSLQLSIGLNL